MSKMIPPRNNLGKTLKELGREHPNLVVLDGDVGMSSRAGEFADEFPERFFQMGIAEQNMIGVACGLALSGKIAVASSFAMFAVGKPFEQIRQSVCYANLNVKIVGTHVGFSVGKDGATHQCIEDMAIMRSLPNMKVLAPADYTEVSSALRAAVNEPGPVYVRISRAPSPVVFEEGHTLEIGKGSIVREGTDVTVIAAGIMVAKALDAAEILAREGISVRVVNMPSIKPIDKELIARCARETGAIVTAENHTIYGGLGSAVAEVLVENVPVPMRRIGIPDTFGYSTEPDKLYEAFNMTAEAIAASCRELAAGK